MQGRRRILALTSSYQRASLDCPRKVTVLPWRGISQGSTEPPTTAPGGISVYSNSPVWLMHRCPRLLLQEQHISMSYTGVNAGIVTRTPAGVGRRWAHDTPCAGQSLASRLHGVVFKCNRWECSCLYPDKHLMITITYSALYDQSCLDLHWIRRHPNWSVPPAYCHVSRSHDVSDDAS